MNSNNLSDRVKQANKLLYDRITGDYEKIDGRRSEVLSFWLRDKLKDISALCSRQDRLLDIGCGTGFVMKSAQGLFKKIYGIDISFNILENASLYADGVICADSEYIPFSDRSVDMVVLFAALHHFYDFRVIIKDIYRILRQGGILYIDHDINSFFVRRFRPLLSLYRKINSKKRKFLKEGINGDLYDLSEFHSDGVDPDGLKKCLVELDFTVIEESYHWYGLSRLTDFILKNKSYKSTNAPLISIIAKKI